MTDEPFRRRLIPAYAGRTDGVFPVTVDGWAHPRLRGVDTIRRCIPSRQVGSSPLTRGGPKNGKVRYGFKGLIPAYAGRTLMQA